MLILSMSVPNPLTYIQFHPVAYMVKLNIEMSMATLIIQLARGSGIGDEESTGCRYGYSNSYASSQSRPPTRNLGTSEHDIPPGRTFHATVGAGGPEEDFNLTEHAGRIHKRVDVRIDSTASTVASTVASTANTENTAASMVTR